MRYQELGIQTRREDPARVRSVGAAFLIRAGYITPDNEPTRLGQLVLARLKEAKQPSELVFQLIDLKVLRTRESKLVYESEGGGYQLLRCPNCNYAASHDLASYKKKAPPAEPLQAVERVSTPDCRSIEALAKFLAIPTQKTAKALMYTRKSDGRLIFALIRGDTQISERKLHSQIGEIEAASADDLAKVGAVGGYASPIGLQGALVVVDDLITQSPNLVAGANEKEHHLKNTNCGRDYFPDLITDLVLATEGDPCPECGSSLVSSSGHLVADEKGILPKNILLAIAEAHHDKHGLLLPELVAPFPAYLMHVPSKHMDTQSSANELYKQLQSAGLDVLYDDRQERAGVKFNDADLIGLPVRLTIGEKNLRTGMIELKLRKTLESRLIHLDDVTETIRHHSQEPT